MSYSAMIKIDSKRVKKDGTAAIFLQVIIERKKARIDLQIAWPPSKFADSQCKPRWRNDVDVNEYNIVIGNAQTKANNIRKAYLVRGIPLSLDTFLKEYRTNLNRTDFIEYFAQKSFERWTKQRISDHTYNMEKVTLKRLREYAPVLPFHEFTPDWAHDFDRSLKKIDNSHNTRFQRHRHIITYLNMAKEDKINYVNPYGRFKAMPVESTRKPLEIDQMKSLIEYYLKHKDNPIPLLKPIVGKIQKDTRDGLTQNEVYVLRRFLFSCNCSLRISDLMKLERTMFDKGQMSITPTKTLKYGTKITSVPLNDVALMLLEDEMNDNQSDKLFNRICEQSSNKLLKVIAGKAKIDAHLHHHVARYTFASLMDQAGANHTGLMKYMGLRKRDTLEKYVKASEKVIEKDIKRLNEFIR